MFNVYQVNYVCKMTSSSKWASWIYYLEKPFDCEKMHNIHERDLARNILVFIIYNCSTSKNINGTILILVCSLKGESFPLNIIV